MSDCSGWVRLSGNAYYSPHIAATPTKWTFTAASTDGSYVPTGTSARKTPRSYAFTQGKDLTYTGTDDSIATLPFRSVDESNGICDAINGCAGWVRYGGKSYYRPHIAATPTTWTGQPSTDGTYVPPQ